MDEGWTDSASSLQESISSTSSGFVESKQNSEAHSSQPSGHSRPQRRSASARAIPYNLQALECSVSWARILISLPQLVINKATAIGTRQGLTTDVTSTSALEGSCAGVGENSPRWLQRDQQSNLFDISPMIRACTDLDLGVHTHRGTRAHTESYHDSSHTPPTWIPGWPWPVKCRVAVVLSGRRELDDLNGRIADRRRFCEIEETNVNQSIATHGHGKILA